MTEKELEFYKLLTDFIDQQPEVISDESNRVI